MQVSIQSLEVIHNKVPYRFIVKRILNTSKNVITFHCWAPEDNMQSKELINSDVLMFEWDDKREELKADAENPVVDMLKQAIKENFFMERA